MSKPDHYMHVGAKNLLIEQHVKDREAAELRADIEAFVAKGGKIEVLGNTPRRDIHDYKKAESGRKGGRKNKRDPAFHIGEGKTKHPVEFETESLDDVAAEEEPTEENLEEIA